MKLLTILATLLPVIMASPAAGSSAIVRRADSTCDPSTDFGHAQGTHNYICAQTDVGEFNCIEFKQADFCSGTIFCDGVNLTCNGNDTCYFGICATKVNAKQCQRTCSGP
ncbi:hypothetical protein QBC43DRAFT_354219 [Cladorrhinum sp. PSN259]|nr:hypothetical protein QBC43DRAFT_354219 [Cladorrhinum sp. PSN259]